jgi:excisionase family DNA binding protein
VSGVKRCDNLTPDRTVLSSTNRHPLRRKAHKVDSAGPRTHLEITAAVQRRTLTVEEAGKVLGLGRSAAYGAAQRGELPTIRIGRKLLVPVDRLEQLLAGEGVTDAVA